MNEIQIPPADYHVTNRGPFGTPVRDIITSDRALRRTPDGHWAIVALDPAVTSRGLGVGMPMSARDAARLFPQHAETILSRDRSR